MLKQMFFGAVVCAASVAWASDVDNMQAGAKKLADASSYSWKTTSEGGGFGGGPQEGKTEKGGVTLVTYHFNDNEIQVAKKGDKIAIKTEDGWKSSTEMENGDQQGPGRFIGQMARAFKTPGEQAVETTSKLKEVKKVDDAFTFELTGDAAKEAMPRMGRRGGNGDAGPQINNAKIAGKVWVKDGMPVKMQMHVTATINFNGEDRDIDRTTTTEISDVGSTKVELPDEAKKKLE